MNPYSKSIKLIDNKFVSLYIYHMIPGGIEKRHYHDGVEVEYVIKGSCKTHKKGQLYFRKKGEAHEGINDSHNEVVFICLTIPSESRTNTHYL